MFLKSILALSLFFASELFAQGGASHGRAGKENLPADCMELQYREIRDELRALRNAGRKRDDVARTSVGLAFASTMVTATAVAFAAPVLFIPATALAASSMIGYVAWWDARTIVEKTQDPYGARR